MIYNYTNSPFEQYLTYETSTNEELIHSWIPPHVLEEEKEDFITVCLSLYTDETKENEKYDLCQAISYLPASKRLEGVLSRYLIDTMNADEKMIHIWMPSSIPEQEIMDRVQACLALYTSGMPVVEKYELFLSLNHVPVLTCKKTVQATSKFLTPEMSVNEKMIYLWMPPSIPEQEKIDVVQACLLLFTDTMFVKEKFEVFWAVNNFPALESTEIVQANLQFLTPEMSTDEKLLHLWICSESPKEEREELVQACLPLCNSTTTVMEKWELLRGLSLLPALHRKDVVQTTLKFLTPGMSVDEKLSHLWIPPHMPEKERMDFVKAALIFYMGARTWLEKSTLHESLSFLPACERTARVQFNVPRFSPTMSVDEKIVHLWISPGASKTEREELVQAFLVFTAGMTSNKEKFALYSSLLCLPSTLRKERTLTASKFLTPEMSINEKMICLWMLPFTPEQEKIDIVQACLLLFTDTMFVKEKFEVFLAVSNFPALQDKEKVQAISKCFTPEMSTDEKLLHLWICAELPKEEREDLVQASLLLFNSTMTVMGKWEILHSLGHLPALRRKDVVQATPKYLTPGMSADEVLAHLWLSPRMPEEERMDFVKAALILYTRKGAWFEKSILHESLSFLPACERAARALFIVSRFSPIMSVDEKIVHLWISPGTFIPEREELVQAFLILTTGMTNSKDKFALYSGLLCLPNFLRKEKALAASKFLTPEMTVDEKLIHLWVSRYLPIEHRLNTYQSFLILDGHLMSIEEKYELFAGLEVSSPHLLERAQATENFLTPEMSLDERMLHLWIPHLTPEEKRKDLVQALPLLYTKAMNVIEKYTLYKAVVDMACTSYKVTVQAIYPYFTPTMDVLDKSGIIHVLTKVSEEERIPLLQAATSLFEGLVDKHKLWFTSILPPIQRAAIGSYIKSISPTVQRLLYTSSCIVFLKDYIAKRTLQDVIKKFTSLFSLLCKTDVNIDEISTKHLLIIFYLLPEDVLTQEALSRIENITEFLEDEGCRIALIHAFEHGFQSNAFVPELLPKLAKFITKYQDELQLHDEHQVMQHAIDILASKNIEEKKNPFALYKKLKQLKKEPSTFCPTSQEVAGYTTAFCLASFRQSAFSISREELPSNVIVDSWQSLINRLEDKMNSNEQAQAEVSIYGTSWDTLWNQCFSDVYLSTLLQSSSATVSVIEAKWRAILQSILEQDKTILEGKVFSAQEEVLIKTAMTIQACKGGKQEGIATLYRLLDPKYRYLAKGFETGDVKKDAAFAFIAAQVEQLFANQCSGTNALMQELTNMQDIEQISHQAIYLKNMIAPVIGLYHEVCFDRHTTVLYDSLVEKAREELLEAFFRHMTPQVVVTHLVSMTNEKSAASLFKRHLSAFIDILEENKDWELSSDGITIDFTAAGIVKVLRKMGYLTS